MASSLHRGKQFTDQPLKEWRFAVDEGIPTLYKFRAYAGESINWVQEILLGHRIYLSRASQLNDPFDMRPVYEFAGDIKDPAFRLQLARDFQRMTRGKKVPLHERVRAVGRFKTSPDLDKLPDQAAAQMREDLERTLPVFSMTANRDHALLWSHYADAHRGLCLHFCSSDNESIFASARKVLYREERPRVPIPLGQPAISEIADRIVLTKAPWWEYEQEFRLIGGGDLREFMDGQHVAFEPRWLTGLTFGLRMPIPHQQDVLDIARRHEPKVEVWRTFEDASRFALRFERIE